jgi:ABC-type spermidine/putrescine transport system permease subunit I
MFVPVLIFGMVMGVLYAWFLRTIWHRELAVAVVIVVFWMSMYLFERSWANVLGMAASLVVYVGLPITILDHFLVIKQKRRLAQNAVDESFRMHFDSTAHG